MLSPLFRCFMCCLSALLLKPDACAQCSNPISIFPFTADFENNNGGWVAGGNNSDWAWGSPTKSVISSAGGGLKCWIVGGLTGNAYSAGEASYLQSPCFDFTNLDFPYIKFKVFWEMERRFDGAAFQYSTDQGNSWQNVGSAGGTSNCLNDNWFNYSPINYLVSLSNTSEGWSGNIQNGPASCVTGGGSGGWLTAQRTMPYLAHQPSVVFRFIFGAGTQCNNFNGFAVDDVFIAEAPANNASFTYFCSPNYSVSFQNTSAFCPTDFLWTFGDPASGSNVSVSKNPNHVFSGPGEYDVTLEVRGPENASSIITQRIILPGIQVAVLQPLTCFGDTNGQLQASIVGTSVPLQYVWNTVPAQTGLLASQLSAGSYQIEAFGSNACRTSANFTLAAPPKIIQSSLIKQPNCFVNTGSIALTTLGGQAPLLFNWSPNVSANAMANGLVPGNYQVRVTDARGCVDSLQAAILPAVLPAVSIPNNTPVSCKGLLDGTATALVISGNTPLSFSWNTSPPQTGITATQLAAGLYSVTITDPDGCTASASTIIMEPAQPLNSLPTINNSTCGYADGKIAISTTGGNPPYQYAWNPSVSNGAVANAVRPGTYRVSVTDSKGCNNPLNNLVVPNIGTPAVPYLGKDSSICGAGAFALLQPGIFAGYQWQNGSTGPSFQASLSGLYFVRVSNSEGCVGTDSIRITVTNDCGEVFFPGSFSPNGDGLNDQFRPVGNVARMSQYQLEIYNRYGQLVFVGNDPFSGWNGMIKGEEAVNGGYVWKATYLFKNSFQRHQQGNLLLIR